MGCTQSVDDYSRKDDAKWNKTLSQDAAIDRALKKLLLLGPGNSGKSTFFKQLLQIHGDGFNDQKKFASADMTRAIYDCVIGQMKSLIHQSEEFEYELDENVQKSANFILDLPRDVDINQNIAHHISTLWNDQMLRDSFEHRTNLGIVDSAPYFFEAMDRISKSDYRPSEKDILLVRTPTTGVVSSRFEINNHQFMIFDVGGQRSERNKWIHCFDSVTAVLFVASLSCYDQALFELDYVNAMQESLNLFDEIINSRWFKRTSLILFLNKADLFRIKIEKKDLRVCFPEYTGGPNFKDGMYKLFVLVCFFAILRISNMRNIYISIYIYIYILQSLYNKGVEFIRTQFMDKNNNNTNSDMLQRQIYSHVTCATDRDNVERVFNDVQHIVVNSSLQRGGLL